MENSKLRINIIKKWLSNKGYIVKNYEHFIAVHSCDNITLLKLEEEVKRQFSKNKCYINDLSDNMFLVIDI